MFIIKYREGYKYVLAEDYTDLVKVYPETDLDLNGWVTLSTKGDLFIKAGYAWDGPSGPAIDTKSFMRGALVHDALFQLMREGKLDIKWFDAANHELWSICMEDGMHWLRAWWVFHGVSLFGKQFAKPQTPEILSAP